MADPRREGVLGWTWLGCGMLLFILLPLWLGLSAAFVHLLDRQDPSFPTPDNLWQQGLFWAAVLLVMVGLLVVGMWTFLRGLDRIVQAVSRRRTEVRYHDVVGDGDVLRADSWATTDGPQPDPLDEEVTESYDPR